MNKKRGPELNVLMDERGVGKLVITVDSDDRESGFQLLHRAFPSIRRLDKVLSNNPKGQPHE